MKRRDVWLPGWEHGHSLPHESLEFVEDFREILVKHQPLVSPKYWDVRYVFLTDFLNKNFRGWLLPLIYYSVPSICTWHTDTPSSAYCTKLPSHLNIPWRTWKFSVLESLFEGGHSLRLADGFLGAKSRNAVQSAWPIREKLRTFLTRFSYLSQDVCWGKMIYKDVATRC